MKGSVSPTYRRFGALLLAVCILALSCSDSNPGDPGENQAPELPPVSSMVMDLSTITGASSSLQSSNNFLWASVNLAVWSTVVTVTMAVPVASYVAAFQYEPERQSDGSWVWSYSFAAVDQTYDARLVARYDQSGITWEMYVTEEGGFEDFLWYEGTCNYTLTHGTWDVNLEPADPVPFLDIEWNLDSGQETADLTYTYVVPASPDSGNYIFAEVTNDTPYDGFYDVYSRSADNLLEIEWNTTTIEGRVRDPLHFADTEWHCWDEGLQDIECP